MRSFDVSKTAHHGLAAWRRISDAAPPDVSGRIGKPSLPQFSILPMRHTFGAAA